MPGFFANLIAGKTADIVESVGNVADKFITTGQEKEEFKLEVAKEVNRSLEALAIEGNKELEIIMKDKDSSRNREIQIANSESAPKLNKIITPLLAIFITLGFFTLLTIACFHGFPPANAELLYIMLGSLGTGWIGIVGYYFGSSIGSSKKQDTIDKMMESK